MRATPAFLSPLLSGLEGRKTRAYKDGAGVWTIGVGHTGPEVHAGLVWPDRKIEETLTADIEKAKVKLYAVVPAATIDSLGDHQYGALLSFVFNLGAKSAWTIWKVLKAGKLDDVPGQMMRFCKARNETTGVIETVEGLLNRRAAEVKVWNTPDDASSDHKSAIATAQVERPAISSGSLRDMETPPTTDSVKPLVASKSFIASAGTAVTTAAAAIAPVAQAVSDNARHTADVVAPMADGSDTVAKIRNVLLVIAAITAIAATVLLAWKHHKASNP